MKQLKLFVVTLMLLTTALISCNSNSSKQAPEVVKGTAGNFLLIKGHGFSLDRNQNQVKFGNVTAHILRADANYILVQVPVQHATIVPVVVTVGKDTSNAMQFAYHTDLASL
ncbi:hypothetical protein DVR12_09815 [Chitinophaga silvatica]|uniref:IPT/TIG domain-containing protein n=1 Tax=Chitinophaga silvatica TaxID=2282649 RepID=A0A3E1YB54_9BACT|nr:IPT/TIG domain-containing protein [Chitinophaga silvatica]RFS23307.1 hypothetical protein DVR12_09815 [Chitinophaga silvatica]